MKTVPERISAFLQKHGAPWWADIGDEAIVIRDRDGKAISVIPHADSLESHFEQQATAQLLAMAPELFANLIALLDVMRRSDVEQFTTPELASCDAEEWDAAVEDAEALLVLLAEDGVTLGGEV